MAASRGTILAALVTVAALTTACGATLTAAETPAPHGSAVTAAASSPGPARTRTLSGRLDGAAYRIDLPARWNGTLLDPAGTAGLRLPPAGNPARQLAAVRRVITAALATPAGQARLALAGD